MKPTSTLIQGDARQVLRSLPAESVLACFTSPPYYGLRAYSTAPQVWGGSSACEHVWEAELPGKRARWGDLDTLSEKQASNGGSAQMVAALERTAGQFCSRCSAWKGELGGEPTVHLYVDHLVEVFREVRRVLRRDGTVWLNLGDSFCSDPFAGGATVDPKYPGGRNRLPDRPNRLPQPGLKPKDLMLVPHRTAIALQEDGWYVRMDHVWHKPNGMPHPVEDRPVLNHEYVFLLTRSEEYYYDYVAALEPAALTPGGSKKAVGPTRKKDSGRNSTDGRLKPNSAERNGDDGERVVYAERRGRSVWSIPTHGFPGAHFATWPEALCEKMIRIGTPEGGCCALCMAPFSRVTEKGDPDPEWQAACGADANGEYHGEAVKDYHGTGAQNGSEVKARILEGLRPTITTGWKPTCACNLAFVGEEPVPATVLDPFAGSATTGKVALQHGRSFVGIELNPDYLTLARTRLGLESAEVGR